MTTPRIEFGNDGLMKWERVEPPLFWSAAQMHVIADRFLPDGTRQHMVDQPVPPDTFIGNAQLVSPIEDTGNEFSSYLSHLSFQKQRPGNIND